MESRSQADVLLQALADEQQRSASLRGQLAAALTSLREAEAEIGRLRDDPPHETQGA